MTTNTRYVQWPARRVVACLATCGFVIAQSSCGGGGTENGGTVGGGGVASTYTVNGSIQEGGPGTSVQIAGLVSKTVSIATDRDLLLRRPRARHLHGVPERQRRNLFAAEPSGDDHHCQRNHRRLYEGAA